MLHKAIGATLLLLLMTAVVSAQMPQPGVHLKDEKRSRTKEQQDYDKAIDREYQSELKKIPDAEKKTLGGYPSNSISPSEEQAAMNARRGGLR